MTSNYEQQAEEALKKDYANKSFISYHYFSETLFLLEKLLGVCEELREARENWKSKYMKLKRGNN